MLIIDRSLLKRSSIMASNLKTLLARPLTFREAIEIVCDVFSNEGDEVAFANLFGALFCVLLSGVEGMKPDGKFEFSELLL